MKRMLSIIFVVSIIFLMSLSFLTVLNVSAQEENTWTTLAPMQEARYGLGVVAENGKIYAMGGYPGFGPTTDINEEYNPQTNTWTTKAPIPESMYDFGITTHHGKIYCISGETGNTYTYTPLYDTWEQKAPLPNPRKGITANTLNDKIYIIGGDTKVMNVYDPSNDSWTTKAPLISAFGFYTQACASIVFEGKIHAFGAAPLENSHQIYDPETDSWSLGKSLFSGYFFTVAGATSGINASKRIYVFGGDRIYWDLFRPPVLVSQVYDPVAQTWGFVEQMSSSQLIGDVANIDDRLYVVGGSIAKGAGGLEAVSLCRLYTPIGFGTPDPEYSHPLSTPTPTPPEPEFPAILVLTSVVIIAVVGLGIFAYFKKKRRS